MDFLFPNIISDLDELLLFHVMDLKVAINHQTELLVYLRADVHFIKECRARAIINDPILSFRYIGVIRQLALNDFFIKLHKLIHHKEDHSISKLLNKAKNQGYNKVNGFNELYFLKTQIVDIYDRNNLKNIRNEYIAHSDLERGSYDFNWNDLFELSELLTNFYKVLNLIVNGKSSYFYDDGVLSDAIIVTEKYSKFLRPDLTRIKLD